MQANYDYSKSCDYRAHFVDIIESAIQAKIFSNVSRNLESDLNEIIKCNETSEFKIVPNMRFMKKHNQNFFKVAYLVIPFLKHKFDPKYDAFKTRSFNYLDNDANRVSTSGICLSAAAYAYALSNQADKAEHLLNIITKLNEGLGTNKTCFRLTKLLDTNECDIQHTCYIALAYIALNKTYPAMPIINWLQDKYIDLKNKAMTYEYAMITNVISTYYKNIRSSAKTNLTFMVSNDYGHVKKFNINNTSKNEISFDFPINSFNINYNIIGTGYFALITSFELLSTTSTINSNFNVTIKVNNSTKNHLNGTEIERSIDICANYTSTENEGFTIDNVIFEVEVPSGYRYKDYKKKLTSIKTTIAVSNTKVDP